MQGNGGPFLCHNHLAAYLNIGLGFALSGLLSPRRAGSRLWSGYAASLIVVGILVSQSRSGFLAMVAATAVTLLVLRPSAARLGLGFVGLLALVVVFYKVLATSAPLERVATLGGGQPFAERWSIWSGVVRAWPSAPFWGLGLGSFPNATFPFIRHDRGEFYAHAENDYLEYLVEGGIVGLALVLLALGATLWHTRRALRSPRFADDSALLLGGLFGVMALATQCLGDFPLHIPAIALTAVVLVGHLARLGLEASGPLSARPDRRSGLGPHRGGRWSLWSGILVADAEKLARAESALVRSEVPPPGAEKPTAGPLPDPRPDLERMQIGLERALRERPDWAEGHLRLGLVHLSLYVRTAADWMVQQGVKPDQVPGLSDPLWLHGLIHRTGEDARPKVGDLLDHDPIRLHLVPAARSFLEARRCCPTLAVAHAELASLDYLLEEGPPSSVHAERALRWAGPDRETIARAARISAHAGDPGLAARCLRKQLSAREEDWAEVADLAAGLIPSEHILNGVVPSGRFTLLFAEHLYAAPEQRADRDRFLRAALERLPNDAGLSDAEPPVLRGRGPTRCSGKRSRRAPSSRRRWARSRNAPSGVGNLSTGCSAGAG